MISKRCLKISF